MKSFLVIHWSVEIGLSHWVIAFHPKYVAIQHRWNISVKKVSQLHALGNNLAIDIYIYRLFVSKYYFGGLHEGGQMETEICIIFYGTIAEQCSIRAFNSVSVPAPLRANAPGRNDDGHVVNGGDNNAQSLAIHDLL